MQFNPITPTQNCLASNITWALLSPQLSPSGRQTLPHILGKNEEFFITSTSVKLHNNSVRLLCFLCCFTVVIYRSYDLRITFVTWQKTSFEYPQKGTVPYFTVEELRTREKFSEMTQILDFHWNDGTQAPDWCLTSKMWLWLLSIWSQAPHILRGIIPLHAMLFIIHCLCSATSQTPWHEVNHWLASPPLLPHSEYQLFPQEVKDCSADASSALCFMPRLLCRTWVPSLGKPRSCCFWSPSTLLLVCK